MAKTLGISNSAVQKRLDKLVNLNIIIKVLSRPRFYDINPSFDDYLELSKKATLGIIIHKFEFKCEITGNETEFENLRNQSNVLAEINNWTRKYFKENNVNFILNLHCIQFHCTGYGKDIKTAFDNAREKSVEIWQHLKSKYSLKLSFPQSQENITPHIGLGTFRPDQEQELLKIWNDRSDPDLLETDDPLLAQTILNTINQANENSQKLVAIEATLNNIAQAQASLAQSQAQLSQIQNQIAQSNVTIAQTLSQLSNLLQGLNNQGNNSNQGNNGNDSLFT